MQILTNHISPIIVRDRLEIERYRLSMDCRPAPPAEGLVRFWERYSGRITKDAATRQDDH